MSIMHSTAIRARAGLPALALRTGGARLLATLAVVLALAVTAGPALAEDEGFEANHFLGDDGFFDGDGDGERIKRGFRHLTFEVAENGSRFAFDEAPVDDQGFPLYGNPFITQGFIYPASTLSARPDGTYDGVVVIRDAAGNVVSVEPEFPDLVLGTWICQGTVFAQDGFNIESGPTVYTLQLYDFNEVSGAFGKISLTSNGLELIDVGKPIKRAVVGGTGPYRRARGEVAQTFLGTNDSGGFALRFRVKLR